MGAVVRAKPLGAGSPGWSIEPGVSNETTTCDPGPMGRDPTRSELAAPDPKLHAVRIHPRGRRVRDLDEGRITGDR